ncbi:MAG: amidohydrolase family protein [Dehalococcoidia bacterium]
MADALLIRDVTLIDGTGAPALADAAIAIEGGCIVAAGLADDVDASPGATVIDGSGLWAVPGLIDTHVHTELVGFESLPVFLALGLTTVRDLGGGLPFLTETRALLEDGAVGPRLLVTGPMIDGEPPTWPALVKSTPDAEAAVRVVEEHLAAGADAIKLYTTLQPESLRRCIEQVDGRVPVTGHLGATRASEAMEAGINGLEHALLTPYNDLVPDELRTAHDETMMSPGFWRKMNQGWLQADFDSERAQRFIEMVVERDVSFCPTLTVLPGANDEPTDEELRHAPRVAERWLEATSQREAQSVERPPEFQQWLAKVRGKLADLVGRVHRAGGRIVAGTDTGAVRSLVPGYALHLELKLLAAAGLSNMELLRSATARAAEALRRDDLGTIEAGKRADVLLVRRDPLLEITALRDIQRIVQDGRVYDPADLLRQASETPGDS